MGKWILDVALIGEIALVPYYFFSELLGIALLVELMLYLIDRWSPF